MALKKFYNKALFYKEFKSSLSFIGILWLSLFMEFTNHFIRETQNLKTLSKDLISMGTYNSIEFTENISNTLSSLSNNSGMFYSICSLIIISFWIVGKERQNNRNEMLSTMPFSREEIIGTKWILVFISIIIAMFLNLAIILWNCSVNSNIYSIIPNIYNLLLYWIISKTLLYIFIFTFIMFVSSICGRFFTGGLLGSIFLIVPFYLTVTIPPFIGYFAVINGTRLISEATIANLENFVLRIYALFNFYTYDNNLVKYFNTLSLLSIIGIIIFLSLLFISFKNNSFEKINELCMFKSFEYILKIGVSVCFTLLITTIAVDTNAHTIEDAYIAAPTAFITLIVTYILTNKIIKYFK